MTILDQSLCLLDGVSPEAEIRLRQYGVLSCSQLANEAERFFSQAHAIRIRASFAELCKAASSNLADWFVNHLPPGHRVRALLQFLPDVTFYDIETDGVSATAEITCITALHGGRLRTFVRGRNLVDFLDTWAESSILVGFNSKRFDTPFVCKTFGLSCIPAQVDLMDEARHFGFRHGLKSIEKEIGFLRRNAQCADGIDAIRLWNEYSHTGANNALQRLIAYNHEDVRSLWHLASMLLRLSIENSQIVSSWPQIDL